MTDESEPMLLHKNELTGPPHRLAASFVVDQHPLFAYMGWHLAHSLVRKADFHWPNIHVQFTAEVAEHTVDMFSRLGCTTHRLQRFGDGKYCNKLDQWRNLRDTKGEHILFLDTDMICVGPLVDLLPAGTVAGKIVDLPNPELELLDALFHQVGFETRPDSVEVDATNARTYRANCNGGFYSVPKRYAEPLFDAWREHATALLSNMELLRAAGKEAHVDQIAFCMAVHRTGVPFEHLPSNLNYFCHFAGQHRWADAKRPLALLHYHKDSINVLGLLDPPGATEEPERAAVADANGQIADSFNTRLFWEMRYAQFPERGSGVGSRGGNLIYKRELLQREGIERVSSVLDVGCGDLEVLRELKISHYVGIDSSEESLAKASTARPDWNFLQAPAEEAPAAEMVLCLEVAIHQETAEDYFKLIQFVTERTQQTLIISGYDEETNEIRNNHMLFFYEPLRVSLQRTGRFDRIAKIGEHSTVVVYRCDVSEACELSATGRAGVDAWQSLAKSPHSSWANRIEHFDDQLVMVHHQPKFTLSVDERFFCMGSCFARNVEEHLIYRGVQVLSKRVICPAGEYPGRLNAFVNKFSTHSMANEIEWVADMPKFDSSFFAESEAGWHDLQLSPGTTPVPLERALERRHYLTSEYFSRIREATVLVLTLGLNEVWHDRATGMYLNATPSFFAVRREPSRYTLHVTDVAENIRQLENIYATARRINPDIRAVVTVSPVPMAHTFSGEDVVVANVRSKSTLRAAAETFSASHDEVDYFPSYDMVLMSPRHRAYEADRLHVENEVVGRIMQEFIRLYVGLETEPPLFNESAYLTVNPDVEAAVRRGEFTSGFEHWQRHGKAESRLLAPTSGPFAFPWLQPTTV